MIAKNCNNANVHEWINKMWYIHTVEYYYSFTNRNEVLIYTTTWVNIVNIVPSERSQLQNVTCMILFSGDMQNSNIETDHELVA